MVWGTSDGRIHVVVSTQGLNCLNLLIAQTRDIHKKYDNIHVHRVPFFQPTYYTKNWMHVVLNTNHTTTINNAEPDPDECNHGADTWWRWLVYERRRRRHVWPDWLWHCVQWWTTQHPGNVVHKAHRSAFGCVSPRTPPHSVTCNILSSILSFQHTCNSFIPFFSFLQHNNWEKLTTIFNSTIINSWGIFDELKHGLLSVQILIGELPGNYRGTTFPAPLLHKTIRSHVTT